jgi:hypothetical protein
MKLAYLVLISIMMAFQATASVQDPGSVSAGPVPGAVWPPTVPSLPPSLPCPYIQGSFIVSIELSGPECEEDKAFTTQNRPIDFVVTVTNKGPSAAETELCILPGNCPTQWFSWTSKKLNIPAGASRSENLQVLPDINAVAGEYRFKAEASAKCAKTGSDNGQFKVQDMDYASETSVSGTGQFSLSKDVRSMNSGIKSDKDLNFVGSVDALVKNEYLVEQARGRTPNFQEQDKVDNYNSLGWGTLQGNEVFKSSKVFGGVGSRISQSYNLEQMEYKDQEYNLHQTGSLKKMADFRTAENFTGYLALDARQSLPGQRSVKEQEVYMGAFEIARRFIFRDQPVFKPMCFDGSCGGKPDTDKQCPGGSCLMAPPSYNPPCFGSQCTGNPTFSPSCPSGSCADFVKNLNDFVKST